MTVQAFTVEVRSVIWYRQQGRCAKCGLFCGTVGHFHHRKPRRMGGGRDIRVGFPSNGLLLHTDCHHTVESNRLESVRTGFILYAAEHPDEVPVRTWEGWRLLVGTEALPCEPPDEYLAPRLYLVSDGADSSDVSGSSEPSPSA